MQSTLNNPDTRSLPEGWAEHFDSERKIWYYVDLNLEPPRVTFVHPCDVEGKYPSSAPANSREHANTPRLPQRPTGPRKNSSASLNAVLRDTQRARRATVAQQLYASSLSLGSRQSPVASDRSSRSRQASVSGSPQSDEVASSSTTYSSTKNSVSSTSSSSLINLDNHDPRNFFDCTRLAPGTRRMTVNGTHPSPSPALGSARRDGVVPAYGHGTHELYHPSVNNTAPSPIPPKDPPDNYIRRSALPTLSAQRCDSMAITSKEPSSSRSGGFSSSSTMIVLPVTRPTSNSTPFADRAQLYTAMTEDNLMVMPKKLTHLTPSASPLPLNVLSSQDQQPIASRSSSQESRNVPPSANLDILQPKPIRPMQGISLNLQVQVADISETLHQDEVAQSSKRKTKSQLLKNFGLGVNKTKGKAKVPIDPQCDEDASNHVDVLMDESFVLVDN